MSPRILLLCCGLAVGWAGCTEQLTVLDLPENAACDARTCPNGCCDVNGVCRAGDGPSACGIGGNICLRCGPSRVCEEGTCTLPLGPVGGAGTDPEDAGMSYGDGGATTGREDAGDGGRPRDAGVCIDPEPSCSPTNCAGCCSGDVCVAGHYDFACGSGGSECAICTMQSRCSGGGCIPQTGQPDLAVEDVQVMDVWHFPGRLSFSVTSVVSNLGGVEMQDVVWAGVYSVDTVLNVTPDQLSFEQPFDTLSAQSRRLVHGRVVYDYTFQGAPPGPTAYAIVRVDTESSVQEVSLSNNERASVAFSTDPSACGPGNCTGCCTTYGCLGREDQGASICGRGGVACQACESGLSCNDGACE